MNEQNCATTQMTQLSSIIEEIKTLKDKKSFKSFVTSKLDNYLKQFSTNDEAKKTIYITFLEAMAKEFRKVIRECRIRKKVDFIHNKNQEPFITVRWRQLKGARWHFSDVMRSIGEQKFAINNLKIPLEVFGIQVADLKDIEMAYSTLTQKEKGNKFTEKQIELARYSLSHIKSKFQYSREFLTLTLNPLAKNLFVLEAEHLIQIYIELINKNPKTSQEKKLVEQMPDLISDQANNLIRLVELDQLSNEEYVINEWDALQEPIKTLQSRQLKLGSGHAPISHRPANNDFEIVSPQRAIRVEDMPARFQSPVQQTAMFEEDDDKASLAATQKPKGSPFAKTPTDHAHSGSALNYSPEILDKLKRMETARKSRSLSAQPQEAFNSPDPKQPSNSWVNDAAPSLQDDQNQDDQNNETFQNRVHRNRVNRSLSFHPQVLSSVEYQEITHRRMPRRIPIRNFQEPENSIAKSLRDDGALVETEKTPSRKLEIKRADLHLQTAQLEAEGQSLIETIQADLTAQIIARRKQIAEKLHAAQKQADEEFERQAAVIAAELEAPSREREQKLTALREDAAQKLTAAKEQIDAEVADQEQILLQSNETELTRTREQKLTALREDAAQKLTAAKEQIDAEVADQEQILLQSNETELSELAEARAPKTYRPS
jgi:hypothetical protein